MLQQLTQLPNNELHLLVGALLGELGGRLFELIVLGVLDPAVPRVGAADVLAREARRALVAHVVVAAPRTSEGLPRDANRLARKVCAVRVLVPAVFCAAPLVPVVQLGVVLLDLLLLVRVPLALAMVPAAAGIRRAVFPARRSSARSIHQRAPEASGVGSATGAFRTRSAISKR